jgi:glycosyltransferase involved in cell wall biosynthesis
MIMADNSSSAPLSAKLAKAALFLLVAPTTRLLAMLGGVTRHDTFLHRCFSHFAGLINWAGQGAITLAYPSMRYNPVAWRKQRMAWNWAEQVTGCSEIELDAAARDFISRYQSLPPNAVALSDLTFTIVVGFHSHLQYLEHCIRSISETLNSSENVSVDLILINDDPSIASDLLEATLKRHFSSQAIIRTNPINLGICRSINEALPHASGDWILHLDCDDRLHPDAIKVLQKVIRLNPGIRFISSRCMDIDEQDRVIARRLRTESPEDLIRNNYASHLKAIRKDLHDEIGLFDPFFEGCQDFEFALRTSIFERLLFIPDYLYQYRWHDQSQTVGNCERQNFVMIRVRQTYLLAIHWMIHGIRSIAIEFSGPHALEWSKKIPASAETPRWKLFVEPSAPFSSMNSKQLIIKIASLVCEAVRTGQEGSLGVVREF